MSILIFVCENTPTFGLISKTSQGFAYLTSYNIICVSREQHCGNFRAAFCALSRCYLLMRISITIIYARKACVKRHKLLGKYENWTMINNVRNSYYPRDISFLPLFAAASVPYEWIWLYTIDREQLHIARARFICAHIGQIVIYS